MAEQTFLLLLTQLPTLKSKLFLSKKSFYDHSQFRQKIMGNYRSQPIDYSLSRLFLQIDSTLKHWDGFYIKHSITYLQIQYTGNRPSFCKSEWFL